MTLMDLETQKVAATFKPRQTNASFYTALSASAFDSVRPRRLSHVQVYSVAIHPTYPLVAAGTRYGNVHLFDVRDPRLVVSYHAHSDSVTQVSFHPWFNCVLTSGFDDSFRLWCARDRVLLHQYNVRERGGDDD